MSRFTKIFLATVLVVVGFGVAKFLGQPVLLPESLRTLGTQAKAPSISLPTVDAKVETSRASNGARLLPDTAVTRADTIATKVSSILPEAPALGHTLSPVLTANNSASGPPLPRTVDFGQVDSSPIRDKTAPRATLRLEAPRPIGVDPQSPAAIRRMPPVGEEVADPYKVPETQSNSVTWPAPALMTAGYATTTTTPGQTATAASYNQPASQPADGLLAPPPWPATDESVESRTHIIVDGDTLPKLASRYLTDPARSREIYELNREVLSSPDLLPIGAELKLPERVASASWDRQNWQPNSSNARPGSEANRDITPIRPVSASQGIIPRAQLARPVMVE